MKIILSSKRHYYLVRISIPLIMIALIAKMSGCYYLPPSDYPAPQVQYKLTISSTEGGSVTYPGEGTFAYDAGEVVNLVAIAEGGYYFINWGGYVVTIVEPHSASTIITMNDHYSITAHFLQGQPIWDWWDLYEVRHRVGGSYLLMNDLDSTAYGYDELASASANNTTGWQPIGTELYPFTGNFDGQGYEISNLFINRPNEDYVGLFGFLGEEGVIRNIGVNAIVTGNSRVGGLVGKLPCGYPNAVSNSYFSGIVSGYSRVGGLIGDGGGYVSNSYSSGNVTGDTIVGGLVGYLDYCPSYNLINSYSSANVTGNTHVGGLVGEQNGCCGVSECFWDTETSGQATSDGGIGKNTTEMQDITTFSGAAWDICEVSPGSTNSTCTWNIIDGVTYPFLSGSRKLVQF